MSDFEDRVEKHKEHALKIIKKMEIQKKFSEFAIDKFNEAGINVGSSKAEDMLDELYDIAYGVTERIDEKTGEKKVFKKAKTENRIKAIKVFAEIIEDKGVEKTNPTQNNFFYSASEKTNESLKRLIDVSQPKVSEGELEKLI